MVKMVLMAILSRVLSLICSEVQKTQYSCQFLFSFKTLKDPRVSLDYHQKFYFVGFWNRVFLCSLSWPHTLSNPPTSVCSVGITGGRHFYLAFITLITSTRSPLLWMFEAYAVLWLAAVAKACPELLLLLLAFFIGWAHSHSPYPQGTNLYC